MALEKFEEGFIYRVGRALPLVVAVLCVLSLLTAGAIIGYSFTPVDPVVEPRPAVTPADVSISAEDVGTVVDASDEQAKPIEGSEEGAEPVEHFSEAALAIARAIHQVVQLVPNSAWESSYKRVCSKAYYGYCIDWDRKIVKTGLGSYIEPVLQLYDLSESGPTQVRLIEVSATYPVNESNHTTKVAVLNEVRDILIGQPEGQRAKYLAAWSQLRVEREQARRAAIQAEEARVAEEKQKEELRVAAETSKKQVARMSALTGGGAALGALWIIALSLALLAIERHLRALQRRDAT